MRIATAPRPFVFVLMPFETAFSDVYEFGIRPACEAVGAYCERVDEQIFHESILQRIYNQIAKADVVVADMTGRNPNVFYEAGYAHALGKPVILLTQEADDIPFDLKHYPHLVYHGKIATLKAELERRVGWTIENATTSQELAHEQLEFYADGQLVVDGAEYPVEKSPPAGWGPYFHLQLGIHNASGRVYQGDHDQLGIIVPSGITLREPGGQGYETVNWVSLPDGKVLNAWGPVHHLLPDAWESIHMAVSVDEMWRDEPIPFVLRLYTGYGPQDLAFTVVPVKPHLR